MMGWRAKFRNENAEIETDVQHSPKGKVATDHFEHSVYFEQGGINQKVPQKSYSEDFGDFEYRLKEILSGDNPDCIQEAIGETVKFLNESGAGHHISKEQREKAKNIEKRINTISLLKNNNYSKNTYLENLHRILKILKKELLDWVLVFKSPSQNTQNTQKGHGEGCFSGFEGSEPQKEPKIQYPLQIDINSEVIGEAPVLLWPDKAMVDGVEYPHAEIVDLKSRELSQERLRKVHAVKSQFGGQVIPPDHALKIQESATRL